MAWMSLESLPFAAKTCFNHRRICGDYDLHSRTERMANLLLEGTDFGTVALGCSLPAGSVAWTDGGFGFFAAERGKPADVDLGCG